MWPYLEIGSYRGNCVQMRSLGWALIPCELCPYKKGKFGHKDRYAQREDDVKTDMHRGKTMWRHIGRRSHVAGVMHLQAQEDQALQAHTRSWTRQGRILFHSQQRKHGSVDTWISDVYPPELWDNKLLPVFGSDSPRKPTPPCSQSWIEGNLTGQLLSC